MIGTLVRTDSDGKERTRYFLNDYGKKIYRLMAERYKIVGSSTLEEMLSDEKAARVFIICPFCGGKTEQGLTRCQKCGADL